MPKARDRNTRPARSAEEFIEAAEETRPSDRSLEQRLEARAAGRYYQMLGYRGTEAQKALIDYAKQREGKSIQRLFEDIVMPELERRYGEEFDTQ